jgi:hypothetical protein
MSIERGPPPEVLRIQPRDLELGRKPWQATDEFWHRPCDIDQWRKVDEVKAMVDSITGGCEEAMALSIFADIQRIAARALS